jgi:acyl-CoA hydrolase
MGVTYTPIEDAVAMIRPRDMIGMPLGPGQPGGFLHALGERDDWEELLVFGALLVDLYAVFAKPGVKFFSGFFGPAERYLRDSGADIEFVPADFRRFEPVLQQLSPRVMITSAALPDDDGSVSLSLHAGASVAELHRAGADPGRRLIVEVSPHFPRTYGYAEHDHRLHVDEIDALVLTDRQPFLLQDAPTSDVEEAIALYKSDGKPLPPSTAGRDFANKMQHVA